MATHARVRASHSISSRATGKVGTHRPIAQEFWKSLCRRTPGFDVSRPMSVFGIGDRLLHCFEWHVFMCEECRALPNTGCHLSYYTHGV
jgi:hypothetical protein